MVFEVTDSWGLAMFWAVFGCMGGASLIMAFLTFRRPLGSPLFDQMHYYCTWAVVTIACIAYYVMASNFGWRYVLQSNGLGRSIYFARYIDWALTTPLLLLDLLLLQVNYLNFLHTSRVLFFDVAMILCGLFGALFTDRFKWGLYAIGCLFMFLIFYDLWITVRGNCARVGVTGVYMPLLAWLCFIWLGYPVVWALAEGSNTIDVTAEIVAYGCLDICSKIFFGFALLLLLPRYTETMYGNAGWGAAGPGTTTAAATTGASGAASRFGWRRNKQTTTTTCTATAPAPVGATPITPNPV
jgi:bacteriorhodopsin